MPTDGYAIVSLADADWSSTSNGVDQSPLTAALGATETTVDAYRLDDGETIDLPDEPEQLLVPLGTTASLVVLERIRIPPSGLARVPAGVEVSVHSEAPATVLVVGAPANPAPDTAPTTLDLDATSFTVPTTSDIATAFLTGPLGCTGMKVNARRLGPGQAVPYHTEGDQEELFVPVRGPGTMRIADERYPTPVGTIARIAPDVPRSAMNDGEDGARWVMVGAPPTGGPTDWDPGADILE